MNPQQATKISRFLSLVLRHQPETIGIFQGQRREIRQPRATPWVRELHRMLALKGRDNWLANRLCRPFRALDLSHIPTQGVALG